MLVKERFLVRIPVVSNVIANAFSYCPAGCVGFFDGWKQSCLMVDCTHLHFIPRENIMKKIACFATIAVSLLLLIAVNGCGRTVPTTSDTAERLSELERELRELKEREIDSDQRPAEPKEWDQTVRRLLAQGKSALETAEVVQLELETLRRSRMPDPSILINPPREPAQHERLLERLDRMVAQADQADQVKVLLQEFQMELSIMLELDARMKSEQEKQDEELQSGLTRATHQAGQIIAMLQKQQDELVEHLE